MATVKKDIEEVSEKINKVKKLVRHNLSIKIYLRHLFLKAFPGKICLSLILNELYGWGRYSVALELSNMLFNV